MRERATTNAIAIVVRGITIKRSIKKRIGTKIEAKKVMRDNFTGSNKEKCKIKASKLFCIFETPII